MRTLNDYQSRAISFAIYPDGYRAVYPALGLCGEAGEVAEKIKKIIRSGRRVHDVTPQERTEIIKEIGDVLWYVANLSADLGVTLEEVAERNIAKLSDRRDRSMLEGNGDNR